MTATEIEQAPEPDGEVALSALASVVNGAMQESGETWQQVFRREIVRFEEYLLSRPDKLSPETDCPVRHIFAPGVYAREITLPKGTVAIGKIHRHSHLNFISAGKVRVLTETGPIELQAPCTFVSEVGTKRLAYALEETIWTTVHVTDETDLRKIEDYVIAKNYDDLGPLSLEKDDK